MENKSINKIYLIFLLVFSVLFISVAYATFNSELNISGDISIFTDTTAPTCGTWYLRDSSLTIQEAYDQNKFINPSTNTNWTNTNKKLFIECSDNMSGSFGCINVTEITDSNNNKRYFKEVKEYTTSIKTDSEVVTVTLQDAYLNSRTCTLPVGGSNPYIDKQGPTVTITQSAANKFTYSATDDMSSNVTLQYMVTTSSTTPSLNDSNWSSNISEVTIDNSAAHTYYVWAKDGVNITHQTISTFKLTKTQGTGTTLTLKYNNNSGATLGTQYVLNGTKVYAVATPSTGYNTAVLKKGSTTIATGTGTGNATSTQTISGATTISSSASANTYLVNYDANGGSGSMASQLMTYGTSTALSTNTFTKTGYTFAGWNTSDDGTGTNYTNGQSVSNLVSTNNGSITLYAKWTASTYTVTANANGGSIASTSGWTGNGNTSTKSVTYDSTYGTLPTVSRTGYTFVGWVDNLVPDVTAANYNQNNYSNRTPYEFKTDGSFGNQTNQPYIRFNGTQQSTNIDTSYSITTKNNIAVEAGKTYTLSFYVRSKNAVVSQYMSSCTSATQNCTKITWNDETYTKLPSVINFDNDGNWHLITQTITVPSGVTSGTINIGNDIPNLYGTNSYMDIGGVSLTLSSESNLIITSETIVKTPGNHNIYAKWTPNSYTIAYAMNNGSNPNPKPTSGNYNEDVVIGSTTMPTKTITVTGNANSTGATIGSATATVQTFAGWTSTQAAGLNSEAKTGTASNPSTAWNGSATTNKYFRNLGTAGETVTLTATWSGTVNLPTATKEGYTCKWYSTSGTTGGTLIGNSGGTWTPDSTSTAAVTIYARCTPNTYTVTADANGGTIASTTGWTGTGNTSTKSVTYDAAYGTLPIVSRTGYTFKGWNGKNLFDETKYTNLSDFDIGCGSYTCSTIQLKPNTTYRLKIQRYNNFNGKNNGYLLIGILNSYGDFKTEGNWSSIAHNSSPDTIQATYTTDETGKLYIGRYQITQENLDTIWENTDVQIEEGSVETAYEPYFITSSTLVKTASDHTITAIWEPNSYTIAYNMNNGNNPAPKPTTGNYNEDVVIGSTTMPTKTITVTGNANDTGATIGSATVTVQSFAGWTSTQAAGLNSEAKTGTSANPSTAWDGSATTNKYFRNLGTAGGTVTLTATWSGTVNLPTATKEGYTCKWYSASGTTGGTLIGNSGGTWTPDSTSTAAVTIYARCTPNTYTVTANANGGSIASTTGWTGTGSTSTKSVTYDSAYGTLPTIAKTGYAFKGWSLLPEGYTQVEYIESTGTQYIDTGYVPNDAGGKVETKVSFTSFVPVSSYSNIYGVEAVADPWNLLGVRTTSDKKISFLTYSDNYTNPTIRTENTAYTIEQSYVRLTSTSQHLKYAIDGVTLIDTDKSSSYAIQQVNMYLFAANINGPTRHSKIKMYYFRLYDEDTLVREMVPCINESTGKAGLYDLVNGVFYGNANASGDDFTVGNEVYITPETLVTTASNHNIYAKWTPNVYSVTLNNQDATTAGTTKVWYRYNTVTNGCYYYTDSNLQNCLSYYTITKPTKTGYTFGGYYTSTNGEGTRYVTDGGVFTNNIYQKLPSQIDSSYTTDISLYAKWDINKYYLTYDYLDDYSYPLHGYTDTGYKYDWDKNFKVEVTFRLPELNKRYAVFSAYNSGNTNLALEVSTVNKLRIYMNKGTHDVSSSTTIPANTDITATYIWNAETKTYTLTATGTNVDISMSNTVSSMTGVSARNVYIGRDERTGVFSQLNISMFKISTEYDYNTTISTLPTATKEGYTYSGWYDASTGGNLVNSVTIPASNKTIYAHSTPNTYTIAYAMNNGTNPSPKPTSGTYNSDVVIGSTTMPTKTITVTGNANSTGATVGSSTATVQTFAGWTSNSEAGLGTGAKTGTSASPSTAWDGSATTNKYFKNLRDTSGTVTLTANWSGTVNLPTVTKAGYVCKWYSTEGTTGGTLIGNSGGTWTPDSSSTAAVTVYARCTPNVVTVNVKNGTSASTKGYSLSLSTNSSSDTATYTATNSNGTVTFSGVANGTYYIYSGKNSNALSTRLNTGKTVTVSNNSPSAVTVQYYGLTLAIGTGITSVSNGGTSTTNAVEYLYNSSSLQSIAIDATVTSGYTWSTWTASGTTLNTYTAGTKSQNVKMGAGATTLTASAVYSSTPVITTTDHNTFSVSANSGSKYLISKTQTTKPEANTSGWSTTSTQDVSTTAKETWYVWAKDANGNVSNNYATITNYVITLSAGTGTTLTAKANTSSGTTVTNGMYVLSGSTVYPTGALSTGYKTLVVQKNGSTITNNSGQIIEADTTFATSATPNTYSITLNNQSATSAGTTKVWYRYKTVTDGCYYYTDSSLSTCLANYTITKPTKTGYTFGGYYTSTNGGGTIYIQSNGVFTNNIYQKLPSEINSNYTNDITLYAKWTANTYTIAYAMNNGANPNPKPTSGTYNSDVAIGTTTAPSKTVTITPNVNGSGASIGSAVVSTQTFTGWTSSTAAGLGTGAKTGTSANPSTAWAGAATTNKYFKNLRDTSGTVTLTANWSGSATLPTVTKTGHTCSWYDTEGTTGGNLIGNSGGSYTIPSNSSTAVTIYARCTPNSYTLTVNPNGGSWNGTTSNTTITQNYGTTYSIDNNPTRAGYVFTGWTKSGTGTYNYYDTNSGTPSSTTTMNFNSASSTLPNVYNNKGNGTVTRAMVADSTATGGYSLKITTNGEANPYAGGISASIVPTTPSTIHVLEIKAKIPTGYNIQLVTGNLYHGTGSVYKSDNRNGTNDWNTYYLVVYGGDTGIFSPYAYLYLSGSDNTSVTWYVDYITVRSYTRDQAKSLFTFGAGNGTLTANWAAGGSKISFNPYGGVWDSTNVKSWTNNYYNVSTINADRFYRYNTAYGTFPSDNSFDWTPDDRVITKEGYTFGGWYTAANGGGTQIFNTDGTLKTSISGYSDANGKWIKYDSNVTLYARWIPNSYTITYDLHNGTNNANNPSSYTIESNDITLSAPTRSGYTFNGWSSNNLFDMNAVPNTANKYVNGSGSLVGWTAGSVYKINVNPNTTYTIVNSGGSVSPGYAIYDSSNTRLAGENYQSRKVITFTTPANSSYILVSVVANYTAGDAYRYDKNIFELYETNGLTSTYDTYVTKTIPTGSMGDKSFTANWSKEMSDLTITLSQNSYTYDGSAKTPTVTVKDGSTTLTKDVDYKVSYSNNTNAGTATVTITTLGAYNSTTKATYTGTTSKTFTINRQAITFPTCSDKAYTASEQTLFEAHSSGNYTNAVIKGTTVGEYTGTLTPASNYQWSTGDNVTAGRTLTCNIVKSDTTTTLANITKTYNGSNQAASGATAKLNSNNTSISGAAFTYKYYTNNLCNVGETTTAPKNAGTYYVKATLTGTTNYETSTSNCATYTMNSKKTTITYNYNNAYQITFANGEYAETGYYIDWDNDFTISGVWKYPTAAKRYLVIGNNSDGTKTLNIEATTENKFRIYMGNGGAAVDAVSSTTIGRNVDITYTYSWVASTHTYTFTATGSSTNISMTGTASTMTGVSAIPLRYGTRDNTNSNSVFTTTTYHKTLNITKVYTADGTNTLDISTASKPAYTFNGWYTASTGGTAVSNETLVPATNTTYYAQWTPNTFQVKFNANGGSGTMANESFTFDQAKALTANAFVREGYTFVGWSNNSTTGATSGIYYDGQSVSNLTKTNNATVNLYALWRSNGYQVVYDGNGNTSGSMSNQNMTYGTAGTLTANGFTKTGYTFNNWKTSTSTTGVSYNNQASININPNMITGTSAPAALPTSSVTTGYAYSGRWARTSTSITPTIVNMTDTPSSLITKGFNIPSNTTSANYYMYVQYMLVDYNQPYTLSVYAKGSGTLILRAGNSTPYKEETFTLTDTWTRYSMKVIPVNSNTAGTYNARTAGRYLHNIGFGTPAGNGAIQVAGVKFEIGETATEYTDSNNTLNLHAQWTPTTYTIAYAMNNGANPNPKPTSGTYNSDVAIGTTTAPTKSVTFTPNANGTDANMGSAVVSSQTFSGWSSSTSAGLGSNAKTGTSSNPSTTWAGATTTNKYFKNLRDTSGTVTLTANWSGSVTLPTVTKAGCTCKWYDTDGTTGGNLIGNSGGSYTVPSNSSTAVTIYARCTPNPLTFNDKTVESTYNETTEQKISTGVSQASNGSGTYTYDITAGNTNNYFRLDGRHIMVAAGTPANAAGYQITITARDSNTGATKEAKYTIIVNKHNCVLTTSAGPVTPGDTVDLSTTAYNVKGELSYAFKSGGRQTTTPSTLSGTNNKTFTAGAMSAANDTNQPVDLQITDTGDSNYKGCTKDLVLTVKKKTNTLASNNHTVYVTSENNYSDLIRNNNGGELTATITSDNTTGGVHDTTNKKYTAGVLSASNDADGSAVFSVTSHRTTTVAQKTVNSTLTVEKYSNTLAADDKAVYVTSSTALTNFIKNQNGGELTVTKGKDNTSGSSISNGNFVAGELAANNDADRTVALTYTSARTTTVKASGNVNVTVTVQKYTNALSWTGSTPANNATLGYGGSYTATATPANNGGTNGAITYTSGTTATMTINSSTGAITVKKADGSSSVITASMAATTTVKAATLTRTFKTGKGTCPAPTSVEISQEGVVTWTQPSGAASSQISIDNTTFTAATSGVNYNSSITASSGTRTVYVRSVCDTTYYTSANSTSSSRSIAVNRVKLVANYGIGSLKINNNTVTSGQYYNFIRYSTISISATAETGYTWYRWTGSANTTANPTNVWVDETDKTIYASATANTYTVAYAMNNGTDPDPKPTTGEYDEDVEIGTTSMPTKTITVSGNANGTGATIGSAVPTAQTFAGWTSSSSAGLGSGAYTDPDEYAMTDWDGSLTTNQYFRNLRDTSGTVTLTANWSGAVNLPTVTKEGHTCKWYSTEGTTGGTLIGNSGGTWTPDSNSSTSVTVYARCTINQYTLTINPNGGSYNGTTSGTLVTQDYGTTYSFANNPTKTGYVFNGWTLSGAGTYTVFDAQNSTETENNVYRYDSANSTLPSVLNNSGGGTVTIQMESASSASGGYSLKVTTNGTASPGAGGIYIPYAYPTTPGRINWINIAAKIPTGYSLKLHGHGCQYIGCGSNFFPVGNNAGTGQWESYKFVFYTGDAGKFNPSLHMFVEGTNNTSVSWNVATVRVRGFTKEQFKSEYEFGAGDATLTANWELGGSRVTFDANGGSFNSNYVGHWKNGYYDTTSTTANRHYNYDTAYNTYPGNSEYDWTPDPRVTTRTGYTLQGWYTAASGGTKVFNANGTLVSNVSGYSNSSGKWIRYDSNATLYAQWTPNIYTITLDKQGGTGGTDAIYEKYDDGYYLTYTSGTVSNKITTSPNSNKLLNPQRIGYYYDGYYTGSNGTGTKIIDAMDDLTSNAQGNEFSGSTNTLYAKWNAWSYTQEAQANGGTMSSATNGWSRYPGDIARRDVYFDATLWTVPTPTRSGKTFDGWYNNSDQSLSWSAGTGTHSYKKLAAKVVPGATYTVKIGSATRTAGSATQFTVTVYDHTTSKGASSTTQTFGSNKQFNVSVPADWNSSDDISILIYCGLAGSTNGNTVNYSNIRVSSSNLNGGPYTGSSVNKIPGTNYIYAHWK